MMHKCDDCKIHVLEASRRTYADSGSIADAYKAAVVVLRQHHPELSDPEILAGRVAVIIRRAVIESQNTFWQVGNPNEKPNEASPLG